MTPPPWKYRTTIKMSRWDSRIHPNFRALYLGPWSDYGRKPTLLLPFVGHLISGVVPVLVVYFEGGGKIKSCLSPRGAHHAQKMLTRGAPQIEQEIGYSTGQI